MININFLKNYILKKQETPVYTSEQLDEFSEEYLKDIVRGMIIMNKLTS